MSKHTGTKVPFSRRKKIIIAVSTSVLAVAVLVTTAFFTLINANVFGGADISDFGNIPEVQEKSVNILICGIDNDMENDNYTANEFTDVIMLLHFDIESGSMRILQIPRDTFVGEDVRTGGTGKINGVYSYGENKENKIRNTVEVINEQFGMPIDHYVTITMEGFRAAINAVGGIEMDVPYDIHFQDGTSLYAGEQTLNGEFAEKFVRHRETYANGDLGRVQAQRVFISAAFKQLTGLGKGEMMHLAGTIFNQIETDMTISYILGLAEAATGVDPDNMEMYMVPGEPTYWYTYSIYSVHKQQLADLLNGKFRTYTDSVPQEELTCIELSNEYDYYDDDNDSVGNIVGNGSGTKRDDGDGDE